jgi:hypothetical protein
MWGLQTGYVNVTLEGTIQCKTSRQQQTTTVNKTRRERDKKEKALAWV